MEADAVNAWTRWLRLVSCGNGDGAVVLVGPWEAEVFGSCGSQSVHGGPRDHDDDGLVGRSASGKLFPVLPPPKDRVVAVDAGPAG